MRQPPPDFAPTVKEALDAAKERIVAGDAVGALDIYRRRSTVEAQLTALRSKDAGDI